MPTEAWKLFEPKRPKMKKIHPLPDKILGTVYAGERKIGSIHLLDDIGTTTGIRPRWTKIYAVGKNIDWLEAGQWVLVENGRWTEHVKMYLGTDNKPIRLAQIDPEACLMVSYHKPTDISEEE
jgi:hypothetical protein